MQSHLVEEAIRTLLCVVHPYQFTTYPLVFCVRLSVQWKQTFILHKCMVSFVLSCGESILFLDFKDFVTQECQYSLVLVFSCAVIPVDNLSPGIRSRGLSVQYNTACCTVIPVHNLSPGIRSGGLSIQYSTVCCRVIPVYNLSPGIRSRGLSVQYSVLHSHTSSQSITWHKAKRVVSTVQCVVQSY